MFSPRSAFRYLRLWCKILMLISIKCISFIFRNDFWCTVWLLVCWCLMVVFFRVRLSYQSPLRTKLTKTCPPRCNCTGQSVSMFTGFSSASLRPKRGWRDSPWEGIAFLNVSEFMCWTGPLIQNHLQFIKATFYYVLYVHCLGIELVTLGLPVQCSARHRFMKIFSYNDT